MRIPHVHVYRLTRDENDYDWGGLRCRLKEWTCWFCPAKKRKMSGKMPL